MGERKEEIGSAGKAIITFARGWQTLVATRSLGRRGVGVITGDELVIAIPADLRTDMDDVIAIQWHAGFSRIP